MNKPNRKGALLKSAVKLLLSIAQSDREWECIRVAIYKASGITPTEARRKFGFQNMETHASAVDKATQEAEIVSKATDDLAKIQDKALPATFGIEPASESDSSESEGEDMPEIAGMPVEDSSELLGGGRENQVDLDDLVPLMRQSGFNWFEFFDKVEAVIETEKEVSDVTESFSSNLAKFGFSQGEVQQISQTRQAFFAAQNECNAYELGQIARAVNGEIVSDDESDVDPQDFVMITDPLSETAKALVLKQRTAILRRARRLKAKALAQKRFLGRKVSKRANTILTTCPDIGEQIEKYVQEHNVGADAWRHTGVLTFDGNIKLKKKVTYEGIRQHLQHVNHRHFSYGTVVELCVARNKQRRSAKRYHSLAKVQLEEPEKDSTYGITQKATGVLHFTRASTSCNIMTEGMR